MKTVTANIHYSPLYDDNGSFTHFWSKSLINIFGSELFDMGRLGHWKRQYFFVRPNGNGEFECTATPIMSFNIQ